MISNLIVGLFILMTPWGANAGSEEESTEFQCSTPEGSEPYVNFGLVSLVYANKDVVLVYPINSDPNPMPLEGDLYVFKTQKDQVTIEILQRSPIDTVSEEGGELCEPSSEDRDIVFGQDEGYKAGHLEQTFDMEVKLTLNHSKPEILKLTCKLKLSWSGTCPDDLP
jgi:hypothetical protein